MQKEVKTFLKEDEADDVYKAGDTIKHKRKKGVVLWVTHYVIVAEFTLYTWKERLQNWWRKYV